MNRETITKQDLFLLKAEIIAEIRGIIIPNDVSKRQWLKTWEVKQMLGISVGTIRNMRKKGQLECTKMGGLLFYNYEQIRKLINPNKKHAKYKYNTYIVVVGTLSLMSA